MTKYTNGANGTAERLSGASDAKYDDGTRYHVIRDGILRMTVKGSELKATDIVEGVDEPDSRLKLEHAAQRLAYIFADNYSDDSELYGEIIELLDRQAAITADANKELIKWQAATVVRLQKEVDELTDSYEASSRALEILTLDKAKLATQVDKLQSYVDDATADYAKLVKERDNLADDLLACNREREQLRKHLGIALDHAHDICVLVDIDGNVLDVGD